MNNVNGPEDYWASILSRAPNGEAPSLRFEHTKRSRARATSSIRRILNDPTIQDGLRQAFDHVGPAEPPPNHIDPNGVVWVDGPPTTDPGAGGRIQISGVQFYGPAATDDELWTEIRGGDDALASWAERNRARKTVVQKQCRAFATETPCAFASPPTVAWVMARALNDPWRRSTDELAGVLAAEYAGPAPTAYVNPLPEQNLSAIVRPGRILVDLTHATEKDLLDLVKPLNQLRAMLGYHNEPGGRKHGGTNWTREEFLDEYPRARQKLRVMKRRRPTVTELADEMGMSDATLYRYKRNWQSSDPS